MLPNSVKSNNVSKTIFCCQRSSVFGLLFIDWIESKIASSFHFENHHTKHQKSFGMELTHKIFLCLVVLLAVNEVYQVDG